MAAIGDLILVKYNMAPRVLWQEHLVIGLLAEEHWFVVLTPDADIYEEQLTLENPYPCEKRKIDTSGDKPFRARAMDEYHVLQLMPTAAEWTQYCFEANQMIAQWVKVGRGVLSRNVSARSTSVRKSWREPPCCSCRRGRGKWARAQ